MSINKNNNYKTRNVVASDMNNRFKSKRFTNDRGARRQQDAKNSQKWEEEINDYFEQKF